MSTASAPQLLPTQAAGSPPMSTVGAPGVAMGTGTPKVALLTIMSVTRAANDIFRSSAWFSSSIKAVNDYGPTCTCGPFSDAIALPETVVVPPEISAVEVPLALNPV